MDNIFPTVVYSLCFLASSICAWLLIMNFRRTGSRLLLWSGLCFVLLAANNLIVVLDMLVIQSTDFRVYRLILSMGAVSVLLFGFIWDFKEESE